MPTPQTVGPKEEYQALRQELLESRRYVFERPLLIAAAGIAALGSFRGDQATAVPLVMAGLLLFNLWFTVNRLRSASRIVAYIQLQLEARPLAAWRGWETALRDYRKWLKLPNVEATIRSELDRAAIPDALMYYPAIHRLHLGIALLALVSAGVMTLRSPSPVPVACLAGTVLLSAWFAAYATRHRPRNMRSLIEWNHVVWTFALQGRLPSPAAPTSVTGVGPTAAQGEFTVKTHRRFFKEATAGLDALVTTSGAFAVAFASALAPWALPIAGGVAVAKLAKNLVELRVGRRAEAAAEAREKAFSEGLEELRRIRVTLDLIRDLVLVFAIGSLLRLAFQGLHSLVSAPMHGLISFVLFLGILALLMRATRSPTEVTRARGHDATPNTPAGADG